MLIENLYTHFQASKSAFEDDPDATWYSSIECSGSPAEGRRCLDRDPPEGEAGSSEPKSHVGPLEGAPTDSVAALYGLLTSVKKYCQSATPFDPEVMDTTIATVEMELKDRPGGAAAGTRWSNNMMQTADTIGPEEACAHYKKGLSSLTVPLYR